MNSISINDPDNFRNQIRAKINTFVNNEKHSINLEKGIFNYTVQEANYKKVLKKWGDPSFVEIYLGRLKSILFYLKSTSLENIEKELITPQQIAFMTHQELCPSKWKTLIEKKQQRDQHSSNINIAASTDTFTCRKCKSNKCSYYQLQTRSADEPMTTYIECLDCGKRWKE